MAFGKLFIVSAPSGAGKTTLVQKVLADCKQPCSLKRTITYTTRPAREGEVDGQDYHFISVDEFKEKITRDFFIEWSTWYDHYYGSPASTLQAVQEGASFIMILDRQGARDVAHTYPHAVLIWIEPPSIKELERRLRARGDGDGIIQSRLNKAAIEIEQERNERLYQYVLINDDFEQALAELKKLIATQLKLPSDQLFNQPDNFEPDA